jgi:hypothetical protein
MCCKLRILHAAAGLIQIRQWSLKDVGLQRGLESQHHDADLARRHTHAYHSSVERMGPSQDVLTPGLDRMARILETMPVKRAHEASCGREQ